MDVLVAGCGRELSEFVTVFGLDCKYCLLKESGCRLPELVYSWM